MVPDTVATPSRGKGLLLGGGDHTHHNHTIRLYLLPFAGGTSLSYSALTSAITNELKTNNGISSFKFNFEFHPIDLPGRLLNPTKKEDGIIENVDSLADEVIKMMFKDGHSGPQNYILFGHSFGAILAYEVVRKIQGHSIDDGDYHHLPLALIVSACRAPSSSTLISTTEGSTKLVSEMNLDEIKEYLTARGSDTSFNFDIDVEDEEVTTLVLDGIRADYKCLETYTSNNDVLNCPIVIIGGTEDPIVSQTQLRAWENHTTTMGVLATNILEGEGHFYLDRVPNDLARIVVDTTEKIIIANKTIDRKAEEDMVNTVKDIFSKVLDVDSSELGQESDFFELGGSSLDTIVLISHIESSVGIRITQNEFFLNPSICKLAQRIIEIKKSSIEYPKLVALKDSNESKWFPCSNSQEQMIALWENNPCMYNMNTTIEFTKEPINMQILHQAFQFVVEQQPTLRTIVAIQDGKFVQKVLPTSEAASCFHIKQIPFITSEEDLRSTIKRESQYIFPMYDPPIVRGVVIKGVNGSDYLFLSQYHVGSDSWALVILRRQLLQAYMSIRSTGQVCDTLKTNAHPNFVDWTVWNNKCLHEFGEEEKQLTYWKNKLEQLPVLKLPLDKPRPSNLGSKGLQIPIAIDRKTILAFKSVVTSLGANLYAGLLAVYTLLLNRMGGGDDFSVGIALANRNSDGLHDLIGYFANEVSVRATFHDTTTFEELLAQVRENILEGMANADVPFHDVVKALKVPRDSSRTPIFQAFFALQEQKWWTLKDICPPEGDNLQFQLKTFSSAISKFEIHMFIRDNEAGGVEGDLTISTDLYDESTGRRLAEVFHMLVESIARAPQSTSIMSYDITPASDKRIALQANQTATEFVSPKSSILDWSYKSDSQTALFCHGQDPPEISFGELKTMISSVGAYLEAQGVKKGQAVGLLIRSTAKGIASIFGVLSIGAAIVVVDPERTPAERAAAIFKDAGTEIILVDDEFHYYSFMEKFDELKGQFALKSLEDAIACPPQDKKAIAMTSESVFGYFYTSGTTGMPKGAIITHGNVLNLINWWTEFFSLSQSDRVLLFSSLSFIMSLRQYIPTLCAGGCVVLPSSSINFEKAILEGRVNKLVCTPSALSVLDINLVSPNIDMVQVAGEAPRLAVMMAWKSKIHKLFIGLGPTELCAHALCGEFDGETVCIGYPASNVRAYIMNPANGKEAPLNVAGELWVSGRNVSKGYLNRPDLTEKHFTLDQESGLRCYKTGDLAKRLTDGRIQFLGRADTQLKVNGFRLEASEIINLLPSEIKSAHVMVKSDQLVLYKTNEVSATEVKKILDANLPPYMVPRMFFTIDRFPLNKNRKLDVSQLTLEAQAEMIQVEEVKNGESTEEENMNVLVEDTIRFIWSKALKVPADDITADSNFFEIGGSSLSAVLVARKLGAELDTEVPVSDVFAHQTLRSLTTYLSSSDNLHSTDPRPLLFLKGGEKALHPFTRNMVQAIGLILMSILIFVPVIGTVFMCAQLMTLFGSVGYGLGAALIPVILILGCLLHLLLVLICKWCLIGRYKEGKAVVFSWYFLKWWLLRRIMNSTRLYTWAIDDTILAGVFLRLLGAKVGSNVSFENAQMLEPDLVDIGDNVLVEFEVSFNTSEVSQGLLELRRIKVGQSVKLGTRSVLLGGANVHDGSEVAPKALVDYCSSTTKTNQYLVGSPAKIEPKEALSSKPWARQRSRFYKACQIFFSLTFPIILSVCLYIGALPVKPLGDKFGIIGIMLYMISLFTYICGFAFLVMFLLLNKVLLPCGLQEGFIYKSQWFHLRKWYLDRWYLSPIYAFSLQRSLETTSSYPLYLRMLGANIGSKAWLTYCSMRVGMELISVDSGVHTGMQTYITTARSSEEGFSFHPISIGKDTSCGQRSIIMSGVHIGEAATIGAETCIPPGTIINDNGTAFGSPLNTFQSSVSHRDSIRESQGLASQFQRSSLLAMRQMSSQLSLLASDDPEKNKMLPFWLYALIMNIAQLFLPAIVIGSYAAVFGVIYKCVGGFGPIGIGFMIPLTFILGSFILMGMIKLLQLLFFRGKLTSGVIHFYSVPFMCWYFLSDMVYFCTQTVFVPFSGTETFCVWLRVMGSKIGKRNFISPENGGLRELDFLDVEDDCHILTPNINSHYADHGVMQFCPIIFSSGCEVNPGATLMPLTEYGEKSTVRPFSVTTKGQMIKPNTTYMGNICNTVRKPFEKVAVLFAGLGSAYCGMLKEVETYPKAQAVLQQASDILGMDIAKLCSTGADPKKLEDVQIAQVVVTVMNLVSVEIMKQREALLMSQATIVCGFSVGEFAALYFAGAISFEDTLKLVQIQCQEFAKLKERGTLCNVRGLPRHQVKRLSKRFKCQIANIISDHDASKEGGLVEKNVYVCGGKAADIDDLVSHVNELGKKNTKSDLEAGKRPIISAKKLRVETANHTSLMKPALAQFRKTLASTHITFPRDHVVYSNVTGRPYTSVKEIRKLLPMQMVKPVKWHSTITNIHLEEGCNQFIECGAMRSQSSMVKLILDDKTGLKFYSSDQKESNLLQYRTFERPKRQYAAKEMPLKDATVGARRPVSCRHPYNITLLLLLILCSAIFYSHVIKFNITSSSSLLDADIDLDAPTLSVLATTDEYTPISSTPTYPIRDEADYIIHKSYTETYARMFNCQDNIIEKDCIALIVANIINYKKEETTNNTATAHTYPWWFQTLLRDIPTNGAYGFWHHFSTNATYPSIKFCAIGKNGSTEWRKIFKALNALEFCKEDEDVNQCSKFNTRTTLDHQTPNTVFVRDPLERLLSGYLDKCVKPNVRVSQGHCEPNEVFGIDFLQRKWQKERQQKQQNGEEKLKQNEKYPLDLTTVLQDRDKEMFAAYVDLLPLKWNVHFVPQVIFCDLYRNINNYDVYMMGKDFMKELDRMANRYGGLLPEVLDDTFQYQSKLKNESMSSNLGADTKHATKASAKVAKYYTARAVRRALEYLSIDYITLGLEVPMWAREMLLNDSV